MAGPGSRPVLRVLVGYVALATLVGLAALPITVSADPANRPFVIRLAAAVLLAVILLHIRGAAGRAVDMEPPSAFDRALRPARAEKIPIDRVFRELLDDVRFGPASHRYWTRVAWPRLCALAERLPGRPSLVEPVRSRIRQLLGRGPSFAQLRDLVSRLEERR
jgi:hypothetical protein